MQFIRSNCSCSSSKEGAARRMFGMGKKKKWEKRMGPCCFGGKTLHGLRGNPTSPQREFAALEKAKFPEEAIWEEAEQRSSLQCLALPWSAQSSSEEQSEGRNRSMDISLSSRRSWSTAGSHPALPGLGKMLQLYTWFTYCRLLLSGVSPNSSNLPYPRWK